MGNHGQILHEHPLANVDLLGDTSGAEFRKMNFAHFKQVKPELEILSAGFNSLEEHYSIMIYFVRWDIIIVYS